MRGVNTRTRTVCIKPHLRRAAEELRAIAGAHLRQLEVERRDHQRPPHGFGLTALPSVVPPSPHEVVSYYL